jgi:hypothetical protein
MTNDLVLKLLQQDVAEDVIAGLIASQPARFSLGAEDLENLKQAGVPETLIAMMQAKKQ